MGLLRGILFKRTWEPSPEPMANSSDGTGQGQQQHHGPSSRSEKWYVCARYIVVAVVTGILITVLAAIGSIYINGEQAESTFLPGASAEQEFAFDSSPLPSLQPEEHMEFSSASAIISERETQNDEEHIETDTDTESRLDGVSQLVLSRSTRRNPDYHPHPPHPPVSPVSGYNRHQLKQRGSKPQFETHYRPYVVPGYSDQHQHQNPNYNLQQQHPLPPLTPQSPPHPPVKTNFKGRTGKSDFPPGEHSTSDTGDSSIAGREGFYGPGSGPGHRGHHQNQHAGHVILPGGMVAYENPNQYPHPPDHHHIQEEEQHEHEPAASENIHKHPFSIQVPIHNGNENINGNPYQDQDQNVYIPNGNLNPNMSPSPSPYLAEVEEAAPATLDQYGQDHEPKTETEHQPIPAPVPGPAPAKESASDHNHNHNHAEPSNSGGSGALSSTSESGSEPGYEHRHVNAGSPSNTIHSSTGECGFKCIKDGKCISKTLKCDGRVNCVDASDERDCTCIERIGPKKVCDGITDCPLAEDEIHCHGCGENQFSCHDPYENNIKGTSQCVSMDERCDGKSDCVNNQDERNCFRLGSVYKNAHGVFSEGLVQKNMGGKWYFICKTEVSDFMLKKISQKVCQSIVGDITEIEPVVTFVPATTSEYTDLPYAFMGDSDAKFEVSPGGCPGKQVVSLKCPDPVCGWPVSKYDSYSITRHSGHSGGHFDQDYEHSQGGGGGGGGGGGYQSQSQNQNEQPSHSHDDDSHRHKRQRYLEEAAIQGKVVGGYDSQLGEWPFLGAIYRNGSFHCGCSIIDRQWILTAAHCTHYFDRWTYELQVGMMRRYSFSPTEQTRMITEVHTHERYDQNIFMNDIAIMKLDKPLHLSKWVTTACLSYEKTMDPVNEDYCTIVGWGDLTEDGTSPDNLQEVSLPIKTCRETFTREAVQICAGYDEGGKDACQGDSGGPFICKDNTGRQIINGLVSFGRGCARAGQLGVYTRISAYSKWIDSIVSGQNPVYELDNYHPKLCPGNRCHRPGGECVFDKMICDRHVDCMYAEDEMDCVYVDDFSKEHTYDIDPHAIQEVKVAKHAGVEHTHGEVGAEICDDAKEFQCKTSKGCVPLEKRCNGIFECGDYTDEKDCDCGTVIANSHPEKKCDGLPDCPDGADEYNCDYCSGNLTEVQCPLEKSTCIPQSRWCDGMAHCPYGEDEVDCFRIVQDKAELPTKGFLSDKKWRSSTTGFVYIRRGGVEWKPACAEEYGENVHDLVCPYLSLAQPGSGSTSSKNYKRNAPSYIERRLPIADFERSKSPGISGRNQDVSCNQTKVTCGEASCGERRLYSYSESRPLPKEDQVGGHPWLGILLVNGEPKCIATILNKKWGVVGTDCIKNYSSSLKKDYITVKAGPHKPSLKLSSPMEQIKRINFMENLDTFGVSLIHFDKSLATDHFAAPVCTNFGSDWGSEFKFHQCYRLDMANDSTVSFNHVDVNTDGCGGKFGQNLCAYLGQEECVNAGSTFIYCTTDNTSITSWYFVGFLSSTDASKCHQVDKNPVKILNPFYGITSEKYQEKIASAPGSISSPPACVGTRCPYGNCVPKNQVCDKILHCSDGQDESRCQRHYQMFRSSDSDDEPIFVGNGSGNSSVPAKHSGTVPSGTTCPVGHFRCESTYNCVPISSFCDGKYDCGTDDLTDEPIGKCDCRNYFSLISPQHVCDPHGKVDCPDRSDERRCHCQQGSFYCENSQTSSTYNQNCIHPLLVCDGIRDCKNGKDEVSCVKLSKNLDLVQENKTADSASGYVLLRVRDEWHPYCSMEWSQELAAAICKKELGYRHLSSLKLYELEEINRIQKETKPNQGVEIGGGGGGEEDAYHDAVIDNSGNLMVWQKDEDLFGKYEYKTGDGALDDSGVNYEECSVAFITCSNIK